MSKNRCRAATGFTKKCNCCAALNACRLWSRATRLSVVNLVILVISPSGDPHAAPLQLHGRGAGKERENSSPGHLLPRSRRQQHPAQLLRGRRHHPARPRGPRRLALRREREDEDVSGDARGQRKFLVSFSERMKELKSNSFKSSTDFSLCSFPTDFIKSPLCFQTYSSVFLCC